MHPTGGGFARHQPYEVLANPSQYTRREKACLFHVELVLMLAWLMHPTGGGQARHQPYKVFINFISVPRREKACLFLSGLTTQNNYSKQAVDLSISPITCGP